MALARLSIAGKLLMDPDRQRPYGVHQNHIVIESHPGFLERFNCEAYEVPVIALFVADVGHYKGRESVRP